MINITKTGQNSVKYVLRQKKDALRWAEKTVEREYGVTDEMIDKITPFRRTTTKPCSLSEPKYFISDFEKKNAADFRPDNWEKMSDEEKVDYIVKDRYSKLISQKIMRNIKDEPVEHLYSLDNHGDLLTYDLGNKGEVNAINMTNAIKDGKIPNVSVHNHPLKENPEVFDYIEKTEPKALKNMGSVFSRSDMKSNVYLGIKAYVVDSLGNKFHYEPNNSKKGLINVAVDVYFGLKSIAYKMLEGTSNSKADKYLTLYNSLKTVPSEQKEAQNYLSLYLKAKAEEYKKFLNLKKVCYLYKNFFERNNYGKFEKI